jgi:hypothetical protein
MEALATSSKRRPWWRLHVTTLFALAAVGSALGYCESRYHYGVTFGTNLLSSNQIGEYGWPLNCLTEYTTTNYALAGPGKTVRANLQSDPAAALFDLAAVVAVLVSTATACEAWRRRKLAWWQFSVRSFFILTAVGTFVATVYSNSISIPWCKSELHPHGQTLYRCGLVDTPWDPTPWYVIAPMLFGIGCVVFTAGWAVGYAALVAWRLIARIAHTHRAATNG